MVYIGSKTENGQVFYQIPIGTYISIVENEARKYQTIINGEEGKVIRNVPVSSEEDNIILVVNHADYDVAITGVFFSILPYVIVIVLVVVILSWFIFKKIKDKNSDEDN